MGWTHYWCLIHLLRFGPWPPFLWEKTQNHKIKKPHRISPKRIIQNPKGSTNLTSSSFAAASASSTPRWRCSLSLSLSLSHKYVDTNCDIRFRFTVQHRKPNYWVPEKARNRRWPEAVSSSLSLSLSLI